MHAMIELCALTKSFGAFTAVDSLDLRVARGELFALLGPNGAGKTTTMRVLMGMLAPTKGQASIDGLDCFRDRVAVKRRVGFLPDEPVFHDYLRGIEIVRFVGGMHGLSRGEIESRAWPLIEQLELADATDEYATNYSRGMKKKLAMVCALLHAPELLILDEPTSGLDPIAARRLNEMLVDRSREGTTVLLSSHLLDQVEKIATRMAIVRDGKLAAVGTLDELRSRGAAGSSLEEIFFALADQPVAPS